MIMQIPLTLAIICFLGLIGTDANAQEIIKTCAVVEVRSIHMSVDIETKDYLDAAPAEIEVLPTTAAGERVMVIALGPSLGSMDSNEVRTDLACTQKGILLTAIITRSSNYHGATAKNVPWNPKFNIEIVLHQPEVIFQTIWRMQLSNGTEVDHAQTSPHSEVKYPIIITKTLRSVRPEKK
jgi:hypothetical protein